MLLLRCPACGAEGPETEFACGGEAHLARASDDASDAALAAWLYQRRNPKGPHLERWRHLHGCGTWFHLARDTVTMEIFGAYPATEPAPPPAILARIAARTGG